MLAQLGAMLAYLEGYVGRSWGLCRPILRPMLAHADPCWAKRSEKWEQQKYTVKCRIFWWSAAYLGAMLAHLGAMLAHLGAMLAYLEGNVGPSWGYVGPSWGPWDLCWPILGLCWPILGAMLAHLGGYVGPCSPILGHKIRKTAKNGKSTKHRKTRGFLAAGLVVGWGGGPSLLRRGEKRRTAMPRPGGPWPDFWCLSGPGIEGSAAWGAPHRRAL